VASGIFPVQGLCFLQKSLHLSAKRRNEVPNDRPNSRVIDIVVISVCETMPNGDDLMKIGDPGCGMGVNVCQTGERFPNYRQVTLDRITD
jgi:hypothetical protein